MSSTPAPPLRRDPIGEARALWEQHGWAEAAPGMAAVTSIMRAQQIVLGRVESVLRPHGVTFARYEVLMLLLFSRRGALPMRVIGSRLQVHPTSVTNVVDRLEQAELVRRAPHPDDRRAVLVSITAEGRLLALSATDDLNRFVFDSPGLEPDDVATLVTVLTRMRQAAGDFAEDETP